MSLDVNTPKGRKTVRQEKQMLDYIEECWGVKAMVTDKKIPALCDGFLVKNDVIAAVFECKCRDLSLEELENFGSWLITREKLENCRLISKMLKIPFLGLMNSSINFKKIYDYLINIMYICKTFPNLILFIYEEKFN